MYQTYITEALVCGSRNSNTSDRSYLLFAREAGMVWASARSVREERSKQRYALQEFSHLRATLVRGKAGWRIAGVEPVRNVFSDAGERDMRTCIRNVVRLLRRIVQGEEPNQELFDEVVGSFMQRERGAADLELIMSLRILHRLGYVAEEEMSAAHLVESVEENVPIDEHVRTRIRKTIDHALEKSHL